MGKMGGDVGKISHLFLIGLSGALSLSSVAEASTCATCAKEIELSKSEENELDELLKKTDQLTLIKTRARYTLVNAAAAIGT